jgi:hypothetical protein
MFAADDPNDHEPGLIQLPRGNLESVGVAPQGLRFNEINPVLELISGAFSLIEFKDHPKTL